MSKHKLPKCDIGKKDFIEKIKLIATDKEIELIALEMSQPEARVISFLPFIK